MYRIRLHGRGGQGIKTASQVLGSAFFAEGHEVQDAPRYGAERRGAPIFAYVRASRDEIHERGVIANPDLVAVADETLVPVPAAGVLQGVGADTVFLIASTESAQAWRERLNLRGPVLTLEPGRRAEASGEVGLRCAGAAARLTGAIGRDALADALREELARYGGVASARGLALALDAFDAMAPHAGLVREGGLAAAEGYAAPEWIELPFESARVAAPDILAAANSELSRTGAWRTAGPVIDDERCKRCAWVCSTFCPDGAIHVDAERRPSIDYDHCKGCLVCVAVCPAHAIRVVAQREAVA
jgi:pyruvate ferredoxin oxidoreductase gamma subunit